MLLTDLGAQQTFGVTPPLVEDSPHCTYSLDIAIAHVCVQDLLPRSHVVRDPQRDFGDPHSLWRRY